MKKIVALIMVAVLLSMALVACDKKPIEETNSATAEDITVVEPVESSAVDSSAVDSSAVDSSAVDSSAVESNAVESGAVESTGPAVQ